MLYREKFAGKLCRGIASRQMDGRAGPQAETINLGDLSAYFLSSGDSGVRSRRHSLPQTIDPPNRIFARMPLSPHNNEACRFSVAKTTRNKSNGNELFVLCRFHVPVGRPKMERVTGRLAIKWLPLRL